MSSEHVPKQMQMRMIKRTTHFLVVVAGQDQPLLSSMLAYMELPRLFPRRLRPLQRCCFGWPLKTAGGERSSVTEVNSTHAYLALVTWPEARALE